MGRDFIWGGGFDRRKCHLVAWNHVFTPARMGGLDCRNLHSVNKATLMKLGRGLIEKPSDLWVKAHGHVAELHGVRS